MFSYVSGRKVRVEREKYRRNWETDKEYGLVFEEEENLWETTEGVEKIAELLKKATKVAVFTGAGVSTGMIKIY